MQKYFIKKSMWHSTCLHDNGYRSLTPLPPMKKRGYTVLFVCVGLRVCVSNCP